MQSSSLELERVFRIAAWIWIGYLASLVFMDMFIYAGKPIQPILWYHLINGVPALFFLVLSYSKWIKTRPRVMIPLMILLISITPILLNHVFDLRLPAAPLANLEGMVLRQLPVLFIGLVLVAWHYSLFIMLLYSVSINIFELLIGNLLSPFDSQRLTVFYFVTIIRTISFVVVGIFINQLITRLRAQQEALKSANAEIARHASTLENLAVSRERNRMARELHDTLAHTLSGLAVQLETVKAYWEVHPKLAHKLLDQSLNATRSGLQETRRALKALRASPLEDLGLTLALRKLAESAAQRANLSLDLSLPKYLPNLSPDVEQCLFRITQEAVENVVQHANARNLMVRLACDEDSLLLMVQDDGMGFSQGQNDHPEHFGLPGMRERAQLSGGLLIIDGKSGQGTTVQLAINGREKL